MLNIIDYELPTNSKQYIVFESISSNATKVIHVVNMAAVEKLTIGRGYDTNVRVTDISVSRLHAVVTKSENGFFYLADNESKFGTLVLARAPI
jgi:pSer/pThr/pTyr-binding forkhead associated (FHA) protein